MRSDPVTLVFTPYSEIPEGCGALRLPVQGEKPWPRAFHTRLHGIIAAYSERRSAIMHGKLHVVSYCFTHVSFVGDADGSEESSKRRYLERRGYKQLVEEARFNCRRKHTL